MGRACRMGRGTRTFSLGQRCPLRFGGREVRANRSHRPTRDAVAAGTGHRAGLRRNPDSGGYTISEGCAEHLNREYHCGDTPYLVYLIEKRAVSESALRNAALLGIEGPHSGIYSIILTCPRHNRDNIVIRFEFATSATVM